MTPGRRFVDPDQQTDSFCLLRWRKPAPALPNYWESSTTGGRVMSTVIRLLIGLGLFTFGFHLGREVGRMEPYIDELDQARRRRGVTIDGESTSEDEK